MLVLSVTTGLRLILPNGEVIRIVNTEPQRRARLGIEAPKDVKIVRDGVKYSEEHAYRVADGMLSEREKGKRAR